MSSLGALAEIRPAPGASTRPSRWPLADIQVARDRWWAGGAEAFRPRARWFSAIHRPRFWLPFPSRPNDNGLDPESGGPGPILAILRMIGPRLPDIDTTPVSLLERVRQPGEQEAWARFVDLYTPMLHGWARRLGLQEPDAADLIQEVFVVLLQKLPGFTCDRERSFRGWLWTIVRNKRHHHGRQCPGQPLRSNAEPAVPDGCASWTRPSTGSRS